MRVQTISVVGADTFALGVTATGFATQADALEMPADVCEVTAQEDTTSFTSGLKIPAANEAGDVFVVVNHLNAGVRVYPPDGGTFLSFGGGTVNADVSVGFNQTLTIRCAGSGNFLATLSN